MNPFSRHYATTGLARSLRQVLHALRGEDLAARVAHRAGRLDRDGERIAQALAGALA